MLVSLLTPTVDRPYQFSLLEQYIKKQTYSGSLEWIVITEGDASKYKFSMGQTVIHRDNRNDPPNIHSICLNYLAAEGKINGNFILCLDDDDWYSPTFTETMVNTLTEKKVNLVGLSPNYYFNVSSNRWRNMKNTCHSSLASTGFTKEVLPFFFRFCRVGNMYIDMLMWTHYFQTLKEPAYLLPHSDKKPIQVGIKGIQYGSPGASKTGHDNQAGTRDIFKFKAWLGRDSRNYLE